MPAIVPCLLLTGNLAEFDLLGHGGGILHWAHRVVVVAVRKGITISSLRGI